MKTALSWSSGKDSAWALHVLRQQCVEVSMLLTTVNQAFDRVAMHGVRRELLEAQAESVGVPLMVVDLPWPCSNEAYEGRMKSATEKLIYDGFDTMAFGDLFLRDIRDYREKQMAGRGLNPVFPLWDSPTAQLAEEMISGGLRSQVVTVNPKKLDAKFAGRPWDRAFIQELPEGIDPCGEYGEFHTFAFDGPMFGRAIDFRAGEHVERDGFVFADVLPFYQEEAVNQT
ncbi:MAG: ATP-binding protein [Bacteroidota bacterium]|nr:ATP-binding protein [Bacteroidota bacterium]MDP4232640.1 ATP-binding protein [Bacteroidota bacterium]MDP4243892.1 ATP-binding protein [Bacteroidota bacterium]MDP4288439.1 ATP-binding protein [Bacteroidota bacterium]